MLAGSVMNKAGITERLVDCARKWIGHIKGGLAMVDIVVCMFFGGISGSAVADASCVGSIMIPAMVKEGYQPAFCSGLTAVASTCAPIIPPSIPFVLYASCSNLSVGTLFIAGVIPGILMAVASMVTVFLKARKENFPVTEKTSMKERLKALLEAVPALIMPLIIVVGIFGGFCTPTEAAAVSCLYAIIVGFCYKELNLKKLKDAFLESAIDSATVMLILAMCAVFSWVITNERITYTVTEAMIALNVPYAVKLLLVNIVLLIIGMFIDSAPAVMMVTPILAPALTAIGMDPIQAAVMICLNLCIGLATPPVGVCLYSTTGIAKVKLQKTIKAAIPFLVAALIVLALITYVPIITKFPFLFLGTE
jgi:tripartite ATP-independent transporter DctM subunit